MKLGVALLGALMAATLATTADAATRIAGDPGGRIITYVRKYQAMRDAGERVIIDGMCASACTIVLGALPKANICVTERARLGFHAAWEYGQAGRPVNNPTATQMLLAMYPADIRSWIRRRGGLRSKMIYLSGRELAAMYPRCGAVEASAQRRFQ
jgi:hypothetical protein